MLMAGAGRGVWPGSGHEPPHFAQTKGRHTAINDTGGGTVGVDHHYLSQHDFIHKDRAQCHAVPTTAWLLAQAAGATAPPPFFHFSIGQTGTGRLDAVGMGQQTTAG